MLRYNFYIVLVLFVSLPFVLSRVTIYNDGYFDVNDNFRREDENFDIQFRTAAEREKDAELSNLPANGELFEEDIQMDDRLRANVLGITKKTALNFPDIKWPHGESVYKIETDFADCARVLLHEAINEYEKRTCIKFRKATNEDKDYLLYTSGKNQCSSNIGRVGGEQKVYIGKDCCILGTLLHETMHAAGFIHEHSRHDRDNYVKVMWSNINKDERGNFNKYEMDDTTDNDVEYNLASVMHYRNDAFTNNGEDTLIVNDEPDLKFGQRIKFSVGDVQGINRLYNCPEKDGIYDGLFKVYSGKLAEKRKKDHARREKQQTYLKMLNIIKK